MTDEDAPYLPLHYIVYDTTIIPPLKFVPRSQSLYRVYSHVLITTDKTLPLIIGGARYYMPAGRHYLPYLPAFHEIRAEAGHTFEVMQADLSVDEGEGRDLLTHLPGLLTAPFVVYSGIKAYEYPDDPVETAIMKCGMYGSRDLTNKNVFFDCKPPSISRYDTRENTGEYKQFLYHPEVETIQKDPEVTQYFLSYDRGIRLSDPPCIHITYNKAVVPQLTEVLVRKYNVRPAPEAAYERVPKSSETIDMQIARAREEALKHYEYLETAGYAKVVWSLN